MNEIATALGQKDDVPNIALAERLSKSEDRKSIQELIRHLDDPDKSVQSDCIKVLYEIGYRNPVLVADFVVALEKRYPDLSASQLGRVRKVIASVRSENGRRS